MDKQEISTKLQADRQKLLFARNYIDAAIAEIKAVKVYDAPENLVYRLKLVRGFLVGSIEFLNFINTDPESIYVHNLAARLEE